VRVYSSAQDTIATVACRGIQNVFFYSLPQHATYYSELVNMMDTNASEHGTVEALYTEFDYLALCRIVGEKRTRRMLSENAASYLFT
jgi:U3 small nucleolar RNA-associated protein 25